MTAEALIAGRMECFTVGGVPLPQGSLTPKPQYRGKPCPVCHARRLLGIRLVQGKDRKAELALTAWRQRVQAAAALCVAGRPPIHGPVATRMTFTLPRPDGHYSTGKTTAGRLLPSARAYPDVRPDVGKLQRAVEDSLTDAGLWGDDGQVVSAHIFKRYPVEPPSRPRPLSRADDPIDLCGIPWADVLPQPGVVIRVWQLN